MTVEEHPHETHATPRKKGDARRQQIIVAGTILLVLIGYLSYRRSKSTAAAATPIPALPDLASGTGGSTAPQVDLTGVQNQLAGIAALLGSTSAPLLAPRTAHTSTSLSLDAHQRHLAHRAHVAHEHQLHEAHMAHLRHLQSHPTAPSGTGVPKPSHPATT